MMVKTQFFTYHQNNSGGSFHKCKDKGIHRYVIIEAVDADHANLIAEKIGMDFSGLYDCPCCGNRWSEAYCYDASDFPSVYEQDIRKYGGYFTKWPWNENEECIAVHNLDGTIEWYKEFKE